MSHISSPPNVRGKMMNDRADMTPWEKIRYWPWTKEQSQSPKAQLLRELFTIFGGVIFAAFGGYFLALGAVYGDTDGILTVHSNAGARADNILFGMLYILAALAILIVRRLILSPPAPKS